jgi:hypothetical protein
LNPDTEEIFTEKAHAAKPGLLSVKTSEPVIIYSGS